MAQVLQSLLTNQNFPVQPQHNAVSPGNQEIIIDGMPLQIPAGNYKTEVLEDGTVQVIVYQDGALPPEETTQDSSQVNSAIQTDIDHRSRRAHDVGIQNTTVPQFNSYSFAEVGIQTENLDGELDIDLQTGREMQSIQVESTVEEEHELEDDFLDDGNVKAKKKKRSTRSIVKNPRVIQNIQTEPDPSQIVGVRGGKEVMFHKCGICGKIYKNKTNWMTHLKIHSKESVFMCGFCGQIFQRSSFAMHIRSHQAEEEAKQAINNATNPVKENQPENSQVAQSPAKTVTDSNEEKQFMVKSHEVMLPNQQMATVIDLGNLIDVAMNAEITSNSNATVTKPPIQTDEATTSAAELQNSAEPDTQEEVLEAAEGGEGEDAQEGEGLDDMKTKFIYKCNVCGKEYNNKSNCHRHLKTHTHEKAYKCSRCDKTYMHRYELKMHSRVHTGERPFKCPICTRAFNESGNLRRHMKIHAGDDTPYKCGVCFKGFTDLFRLHVHLKVHSGQIVCDTCGRKFGKISDLYRHIRIHTGDKPYKCDVCHKAFCQKVNLQTHYRTHTGKHPFRCDLCNFTFSRKQILENHMRGHEEEDREIAEKLLAAQAVGIGDTDEGGDNRKVIIKQEVIDQEDAGSVVMEQNESLEIVQVNLTEVDEQTGLIEVPMDSQETETGLTQEEIAQLVAATVVDPVQTEDVLETEEVLQTEDVIQAENSDQVKDAVQSEELQPVS